MWLGAGVMVDETLEQLTDKMWPDLVDDTNSWINFFKPNLSGHMEFVPKLMGDHIMQVTYFKTDRKSVV